jgi:glucan endo-1,6-beta-glucosidase
MSPSEWISMQGEFCANGDCSTCRQSEWSLATYLGQEQTNQVFQQRASPRAYSFTLHAEIFTDWQSWLQQSDVDNIVAANLNTVRIPMGFWIIEDIVDRPAEPYAEGALDQLVRQYIQAAGFVIQTLFSILS